MLWLKSCPRCQTGDMYLNEDNEKHCMQCGYTHGSAPALALSPEFAHLLAVDDATAATLGKPEPVAV